MPKTVKQNIKVLTKQDLIDDLASGCKPQEQFRIGTEHEQFVFLKSYQRAPYAVIEQILKSLQQFGWQPVLENQHLISLQLPDTEAAISLEPGGQFELSGAPLKTLHQTYDELLTHQQQLAVIIQELGLEFQAVGFDPFNKREDVPWMPKARYALMRRYMPTKGNLGLDMMTRTCTVQVNLDYQSEADMVTKMRIGMALQPIVTALFANSTRVESRKTDYQSYRSHIWQDTDPDRCGILPFVFEPTMGFERYVDYVLKVPMYFVKREGIYVDATGQSFNDFMQGALPALPGEYPTLKDWHDHLTVVFPEVRLKHYLEMRGADSGPLEHLIGLPALWTGLLYDENSLKILADLTTDWTYKEVQHLYQQVPQQGKEAIFKELTVKQWLHRILEISYEGLSRRHFLNNQGETEAVYLEPLIDKLG